MSPFILAFSFIVSLVSCETVQISSMEESEKQKILQEVNNIRTKGCKCGSTYYPPVKALVWNEVLESTALEHSKDMATKKYFAHIDKSGNDAQGRLEIAGYDWRSYGENIFQSTDPNHTTSVAVQAWKNSPGHCTNMMRAYFTEMGIGEYNGYWTQLFGSR